MSPTYSLAWRMLRRDWRAGELLILSLAVIIAVASVSSVSFFTDRIRQALERQANELLGADLVISSSEPLPQQWRDLASRHALRQTELVEFPSMVISEGGLQLGSIKAAAANYPLRGQMRISMLRFGPEYTISRIPSRGSVWVEPRVLNQLHIDVGSSLNLGAVALRVEAVLSYEPGRAAGNLFNIAPTVIMNLADLPATELIQPASRVRYSFFVAGEAEKLAEFRQAIEPLLKPGQRIEGIEDARPEVRNALDHARQYLGLAALVSVLLAGVAVATSARRFISRHLDSCAILRCLGAQQNSVLRIYLFQIAVLGLTASLIGCALGYLGQYVLVQILGSLTDTVLPPPSLLPALLGIGTGLLTLLGFAVPPLLHLKNVPTLRVLRRELGALPGFSLTAYVFGIGALVALILIQAGDMKLGGYVLVGTALTLAVLALAAMALIKVLRRSVSQVGVGWSFGLGSISRRLKASIAQVLAFGLGIMALLLLTLVRGDLLNSWKNRLPADTPNRFVINIQPDQVAPLGQFLQNAGIDIPGIYPMVRGRLVAVNGKQVSPDSYADERAKRLVGREFNLSWTATLPSDNKITAGKWWDPEATGQNLISVEEGIAKTLNLNVNDTVRYVIGGAEFNAKVVNLRQVEWDTFKPNFFVTAPPGTLESYPTTYITSFYLPAAKQQLLNDLVRAFPNFTVIDVAAVMDQVRRIIDKVSMAVEYVFIFTIFSGLIVMYSAIQATIDERIYEAGVLKTLGARRFQLRRGLIAEFAGIGLLSGIIAAAAATVLSFVLTENVFRLPYTFNLWVWVIGILGGTVGVGLAGMLGTGFILNKPPLQILRRA